MFQYIGVRVSSRTILKTILYFGVIIGLASCGAEPMIYPPVLIGKGPMDTVEFASHDKRIIEIEVIGKIADMGVGKTFKATTLVSGKSFVFFDFCRDQKIEWKLLSLIQPDKTEPKWTYVLTRFKEKQDNGEWKSRKVSRGNITNDLITYRQLKNEGLTFFKKGLIKCEPPTFIMDSSKKVKVPARFKNRKRNLIE